jgi:hypothetical protein
MIDFMAGNPEAIGMGMLPFFRVVIKVFALTALAASLPYR